LADFIIESNDGTQTRVHSLILLSRGSDFFDTMLKSDSNYNEKKEGKVKFEASAEAVTQFVKIIYGLDLDESVSLDVVKELIVIGGVYDATVQEVAGEHLQKHLKKENVFELLQFSKKRDAKTGAKNCLEMIVNNFTKEELLGTGKFDDHPDLAIEMITKYESNRNTDTTLTMKAASYSSASMFDKVGGFTFNKNSPNEHSFDIKTTTATTFTGFGLFLSPGSDVQVDISYESYGSNNSYKQTEHIQHRGPENVVPVIFKKPQNLSTITALSLTITGTGGAPVGINTGQKNRDGYYQRTVNGKDKNGCYVRDVKLLYNIQKGNVEQSIISDIYFHI